MRVKNNIQNSSNLYELINKAFIRVLKIHDLYGQFLSEYTKNRYDIVSLSDINNTNLTNKECSFQDIISQIDTKICQKMAISKEITELPKLVAYERLTHIINKLLNTFIEPIFSDYRKLNIYGQEIFDLICVSIFGEEYLNEMKKRPLLNYVENDDGTPKFDIKSFEEIMSNEDIVRMCRIIRDIKIRRQIEANFCDNNNI